MEVLKSVKLGGVLVACWCCCATAVAQDIGVGSSGSEVCSPAVEAGSGVASGDCDVDGASFGVRRDVLSRLQSPEYSLKPVPDSSQEVRVGLSTIDCFAMVRAAHGLRCSVDPERVFPTVELNTVRWMVQAEVIPVPGEKMWGRSPVFAEESGIQVGGSLPVPEVIIEPCKSGEPWELWVRDDNGEFVCSVYRGSLVVKVTSSGQMQPINVVPLEGYLAGVVPSEVPAKFEDQALRAMACVARTYTLSRLHRHQTQGFDLCDSVHCQVYGGVLAEHPKINTVLADTVGEVVLCDNHPINATYHAVCGGYATEPQVIWPDEDAEVYLRAVPDTIAELQLAENIVCCDECGNITPQEQDWRKFIDNPPESYCQQASRFRWREEFTQEQLLERLRDSLPVCLGVDPDDIGEDLHICVVRRSLGGRVAELRISTSKGVFMVGGDKVRWLTSGGVAAAGALKSSLFYVEEQDGKFIFIGGGWGHGVGLCQEGAQGRAQRGQTYRQIVEHYYPGASLESKR